MSTPDAWRVWDANAQYGQTFRKRATGELPEMESSRAAARFLKPLVAANDRLLDVGCGAGHYLRSLAGILDLPFRYTGVDATAEYVELAREAWKGRPETEFRQADIFALPFEDRSFDVVICCNVLLHLPSVAVPFRELVRVARRHVVVRTLVGERSFRIQEVHRATPPGDEFDAAGEPRRWNYYNVYSKAYVEALLSALPGVTGVALQPDKDFSPERIQEAARSTGAANATTMLGDWQVNGSILQPWHFVHARLSGPASP